MDDQQLLQTITDTVDDCITNFLFYDRKSDESLPVGAIEDAIKRGVISKEYLIQMFINGLRTRLNN